MNETATARKILSFFGQSQEPSNEPGVDYRRDHVVALIQELTGPLLSERETIIKEAAFLLDRLDDYDPGDDGLREFCGHVVPSMEHLRTLIGGDRWSA